MGTTDTHLGPIRSAGPVAGHPMFLAGAHRPGLFAPPVTPPEPASPSDRLVAFLGRRP